jgi:ubiquinone/menaquinone biosynthesis C-methylase UbiE
MSYEKQVNKEHYSFEKYFYKGRWMSYWYQAKEISIRQDIKSVLDVGPGTTFMRDILKIHRSDISYQTLDIADDIAPDIKGSVTSIPLADNSYDAVTAFQVLEHIKFEDFEIALQEMRRVSNKYVFISLPHFGGSVEFQFRMPPFKQIQCAFRIPRPITHVFKGQHYWEIGKKGYSQGRIRTIIRKHFDIIDEYVPYENQYHHFFILKIKN